MSRRSRRVKQTSSRVPQTPAPGRVPWTAGLVVFVLALALRLIYLVELSASPIASLKLGDALSYDTWARSLAAGDWIGSEVFYQAPLYPYFLAVHYAGLGESLLAVRSSQAVLGALACVLLALAGARFFSPRAGLVAGLLLAVSAPAIFFGGLVQKTTLALFLLCVLLWLASRAADGSSVPVALGTGATLGALALTRENALVLSVPALVWLVSSSGASLRARMRTLGCFAAGMSLLLAPVLARNYALGGELHLTTSQMGPNLYIGNNPDATGVYQPLLPGRHDPRFERADARQLAEREAERALSAGEVSRFYVGRVFDYVRSEPADWAALMARKLALVWNATEIGDTEDLYAYATDFTVLRVLLPAHFGVFVPLAVIGSIITWSERRRLWPLYAILGTYTASVILFYVFAPYRFPMVPVVLLFAAATIVKAPAWFRGSRPQLPWPAIAMGALAAIGSNWNLVEPGRIQATTHFNLGVGLALEGNNEDAIGRFRRALRIEPTYAAARNELGVVLAKSGQLSEAAEAFREAFRSDPRSSSALANLGELQLQHSRLDEAKASFERAVELDPDCIAAHGGLARIAFQRRQLTTAEFHFGRSLALAPENASAHNNLGVIAMLQGDVGRAMRHFRAALSIDPDYHEARENLERAQPAS